MIEFYNWLNEHESKNGRCVNPTTNAMHAWNHQQQKIESLKREVKKAHQAGDVDKLNLLLEPSKA